MLHIHDIGLLIGPTKYIALHRSDAANIDTLLTDSRSLTEARTTLFFALATAANDGHKYVRPLYRRGVRNFVVSAIPSDMQGVDDANFWVVESPLEALQNLAGEMRRRHRGTVVAITGSRGKTAVKEMIYRRLNDSATISRSRRSWNSQIGVPLTLCTLQPDSDIALVEAGISRMGEMESLHRMIKPQIGIFTDLGPEHDDGFGSPEEKCTEKARLFAGASRIVCPTRPAIISETLRRLYPDADIEAVDGGYRALARAACHILKPSVSEDESLDNEAYTSKVDTSITIHEGVNNCTMVYDPFTNDLGSIDDALDLATRRRDNNHSITLILGTTEPRESMHDVVGLNRILTDRRVDRLITIGEMPEQTIAGISPVITHAHLSSVDEFLNTYDMSRFDREIVVIKGAPGEHFDRIRAHLEAPRHDTILEVNLDALVHNFNCFKQRLRPDTGIIAMVKASAYGIGALETSRTLQAQGAAKLAVAVVDEGIALRQGGITMPIMVLNPIGTNYTALFDEQLEPSIFSLDELKMLVSHAERLGKKDYPVHIKIDTGMHRVGLLPDDIPDLVEILQQTDSLRVSSIFSHLATADCPDMQDYTRHQLSLFEQMSSDIMRRLGYDIARHILNTAGIMHYTDHQYQMVRLGLGLYGLSPTADTAGMELRPVASFISTIASVKHWPAGTPIGYGCRGITTRPSVVATIPVGYADGINRHLGRGAMSVWVNGVMCPTIGNICMDQCMIDITEAPDAGVGTRVEIFGEHAPITRLSDTLDTIPYEVLTGVSPRVKRIYYRE